MKPPTNPPWCNKASVRHCAEWGYHHLIEYRLKVNCNGVSHEKLNKEYEHYDNDIETEDHNSFYYEHNSV